MSGDDRERWNQRWTHQVAGGPNGFLLELAHSLLAQGAALDVACGPGQDALWLVRRGLDVTAVDISDVALHHADAAARAAGLAIKTLRLDLEVDRLPEGPFDVVVCFNYLQRSLFPAWPSIMRRGGVLIVAHPTAINLQRHERPSRRFLLEPGELARLVPPELDVGHLEESWTAQGRHEARLVARLR